MNPLPDQVRPAENRPKTAMQRHEWEGRSPQVLHYEEDRPKRSKRRARPIPESVFEQLHAAGLSRTPTPCRAACKKPRGREANQKPNTEAVVRLAAEKSEKARIRTREAIQCLQQQGKPVNFSTICETNRVSKTFLYDPRHADLAEEIRRLRELPTQRLAAVQPAKGKSEGAKDAQIARLKERVQKLEKQVRELQQENELLYGKLANR